MMNSLVQWYMKKYFQNGNPWGTQPWMGNMFNNMWGAGNPNGKPEVPNQGNNGFNFFNPGNQQFPFPPWIQEVIRQNGFPFANGQSGQGRNPENRPGSVASRNSSAPFGFYPDGFNPFTMFQSPSSNQQTQKDYSPYDRPYAKRSPSQQHPRSSQQPTRFKPGRK